MSSDFHLGAEMRHNPEAVTDATRQLALAGLVRRDARDVAEILGLIPPPTPPKVLDGCEDCGQPFTDGRRRKGKCTTCYQREYRRRRRAGGLA